MLGVAQRSFGKYRKSDPLRLKRISCLLANLDITYKTDMASRGLKLLRA